MAREERGIAHVVALLLIVIVAIVLAAAIANELDPTRPRHHANARTTTATTTPPVFTPVDAAAVARQLAPAVVALDATLPGGVHALGSGMLLSPTGETLTNNHVVAQSTSITARTADGHVYPAHIVGDDATRDVAVVQLEGASNLPTVRFGDATSATVGTPIVVIDQGTGHAGRITALGQLVSAGDETLNNMMQLDAVMFPSGSGGPVADARGRVIAMHTAASQGRRFTAQTASNITFAIPVDDAVAVVTQIDSGQSAGTVHVGPHAVLGLELAAPGDGSAGAVVAAVTPNGPAARAGIAPGNVLAAVDNTTVSSANDVDAALSDHQPNDEIAVGWFDARHVYQTARVRLAG